MILKTITLEHLDLRKVSFHCHSFYNFGDNRTNARTVVGEEMYGHWMDLDRASMRVRRGLVARDDKEGDNKTGGPHLTALMPLDMLNTILCILGE